MSLDDRVFLQEPGDLVRLLACCDVAVIPEPSLGIYFIAPVELRARAGYAIGVSGDAVRRACDDGLIARTSHENGQAREIVYVLTARGRRQFAMDGGTSEAIRTGMPPFRTLPTLNLEHCLIAVEPCFRRGQACIDRQQRFIDAQARAGLCTARAQALANTFGEIQATFAKTFHALSQRIYAKAE
jgi:hypothetical protein